MQISGLLATFAAGAMVAMPVAAQGPIEASGSGAGGTIVTRAAAPADGESDLAALGVGGFLAVLAGLVSLYVVLDAINDEIDRPVSA